MMSSLSSPDTGRRRLLARGLILFAVALSATAGLAERLQDPLAQDDGFPARAGVVIAAIMAAALVGLRRAHPFVRIGPANAVTTARAIVTALLAGLALGPQTPASGWLLVLVAAAAAAADGLDGRLARRSGLASRFGARFDMEVDALLILVLAILVWRVVPVGAWVLASGLMRYAFVAAGWSLPWMAADLPPSRRRQAVCVAQIASLIAALAPVVTAGAASVLAAGGLALLTWSFAVDVRWLAAARTRRPPDARPSASGGDERTGSGL